jgi:hypothetical protein
MPLSSIFNRSNDLSQSCVQDGFQEETLMATTVQIAVTLDASGAVTGVKTLGDGLDKLQPPSPKVAQGFNGIEDAERRAHIAAQLFAQTTGVEIPRALENVIARSQTIGPLLETAFNTAVIVGAVAAVVKGIADIYNNWVSGQAETEHILAQSAIRIAEQNDQRSQAAIDQNRDLRLKAATALTGPLVTIDKDLEEQKFQIHQQLVDAATMNDLNSQTILNHNLVYADQIATAERIKVRRDFADQARAIENQVAQVGLQGANAVLEQQREALQQLDIEHSRGQFAGDPAAESKLRVDTTAKANAQILQLVKEYNLQEQQLAEQTDEMQVKGQDQIALATQHRLDETRRLFTLNFGQLKTDSAAYIAAKQSEEQMEVEITQQGEIQKRELRRQTALQTVDLEQQAAVASLPEWQRTEAQIRLEHQKTYEQLNALEQKDGANFDLYEQQKAAADQLMNGKLMDAHNKLTEQLGSDIQGVFDDITSGNIGKRILGNLEKFFAEIVAEWILSTGVMKSAFSGIFGSLVFGPGSTGANVFGAGGSPTSLLGTLFGNGPSAQSSQVSAGLFSSSGTTASSSGLSALSGFGLPGLTPGGGLTSAIAGTSATTTSALGVPTASSALTSATLAQSLSLPGLAGGAAGSSVASSAGAKSGLFGNLLSAPGLATIAGLGLALTGGALGGKTGQAGALLMSLLLSGKLGGVVSSLYGGLGLAGSGALVGGGIGGLLGFGVGQNSGGLLGSLAGAGSGALTGFMVGGPIGAVVGGIIGLLGGIFGGIFGGSKRKKQANDYANNTVIPDITQITQGFDSFQIDPASAIQQLEQLRTDSQKQLDTLKSQGKDVFNNTVGPAIDAAEKHINDINSQRTARAAVTFGPPQFDTGGMFSVSGNAGLAVLHNGEFVVNPTATKKNLPALASMNAGGSAGMTMGDLHIHPASLDRKYVKGKQFRKDILDALAQAQKEGLIG